MADLSFGQQMSMLRQQQRREQRWSARQAREQMRFQQHMSDTAHQREVADLQAAGLNPVLSAGGQGASGANGAMATSDSILPEMMEVMRTMAASHGGGTKVVVDNTDTTEENDEPTSGVEGIKKQKQDYTSSKIKSLFEERNRKLEKLRQSIAEVRFSSSFGASKYGINGRASVFGTGKDIIKIEDAWKDFAKTQGELGVQAHIKDVKEQMKWWNELGEDIRKTKEKIYDPDYKGSQESINSAIEEIKEKFREGLRRFDLDRRDSRFRTK